MLIQFGLTVAAFGALFYFLTRKRRAGTQDSEDSSQIEGSRRRAIDAGRLRDQENVARTDPAPPPRQDQAGSAPNPSAPAAGTDPSNAVVSELATYFQEQAATSDQARKAEISAHVHRPVPPITAEGEAALALGRRARIAIKHIFPPRLPQRSMSYFGGMPIVPESFDWPWLHNRKGLLERLNFMAQVDCSDLPDGPARHLFPDKGFLYFFAPMSDSFGPDAMHFVTRY